MCSLRQKVNTLGQCEECPPYEIHTDKKTTCYEQSCSDGFKLSAEGACVAKSSTDDDAPVIPKLTAENYDANIK